jgi:hypothetical protein
MGQHHDHGDNEHGPTFGSHGMLLIGEERIFLSHLPMFMFNPTKHPHNFQVILAVRHGPSEHGGSFATYVEDHKAHPEAQFYTFVPDDFEMADLDPGDRKIDSLHGDIHRGHFERGGEKIGTAVAQVSDVLLFHPFRREEQRPRDLEYLLFGGAGELSLAHLIISPPDFDQILSVRAIEPALGDAELAKGLRITVLGRENSAPTRLKAQERVVAEIAQATPSEPKEVELVTDAELYFEEGELAEPATFRPTEEETAAGFGE